MANRLRGRFGYPADDPFRVTLHPDRLDEPLHWRKPRRVFVCSMGDLFHKDVPDEYIDRVFHIFLQTIQHTFLVLTKRPLRMRAYCYKACHKKSPLPHVWFGVSVENQKTADARIPFLLQTPAAKHFISYEPALGPVDFQVPWGQGVGDLILDEGRGRLDWVICGGESGPGARPMNPEWARKVRDQCVEAGVPFFFKQWGGWAPIPDTEEPVALSTREPTHMSEDGQLFARVGKKYAGRLLDGKTWNEFPEVEQ